MLAITFESTLTLPDRSKVVKGKEGAQPAIRLHAALRRRCCLSLASRGGLEQIGSTEAFKAR